uniref:Uncharacterized protein n=1 Tax=Arundo donax TaxID=35708 RepID=A0A0A9HJG2_ARUDO
MNSILPSGFSFFLVLPCTHREIISHVHIPPSC